MARILVVDDSRLVRIWCTTTLVNGGHQVVEATDGPEAIELFQRERPDLTLLDVSLPSLSGLAVLERLRQVDPSARVVMLTVSDEEEVGTEAARLGACALLQKPTDGERLRATVAEALAAP